MLDGPELDTNNSELYDVKPVVLGMPQPISVKAEANANDDCNLQQTNVNENGRSVESDVGAAVDALIYRPAPAKTDENVVEILVKKT